MLELIWHDYLYQPLFNALIWIYNNWTDANLGWAIVILTVMLRFALLPFTLVNEKAEADNAILSQEIERVEKELANDPVLRKEEIRRVLKKRKVRPWAKVVVLGIQGLVLVLLYQVFLRGITGEKIIDILYTWIDFPGRMNTNFYGFELGQENTIIWPLLVAGLLMAEIYAGFRKKMSGLSQADLMYFILFPAAVFIVLYMLPMVKALFVLTSIIFSVIVHQFSKVLFSATKKKSEEAIAEKSPQNVS